MKLILPVLTVPEDQQMHNTNSILARGNVSMHSPCGFHLHAGAWFLADSCETDRQEAAQRNRCTVMVAVVVGGCILQKQTATVRILQTE